MKIRDGQRLRIKGTFSGYGLKTAYKGLPNITLLFTDVKTLMGEELTDHLWMNMTKGFEELGSLYPGDVVAFDARIQPYVKGYVGRGEDNREVDYKLSRPTKIARVGCAPQREGYYHVCPRCGFHHIREYERCRRCGAPPRDVVIRQAEEEFKKFTQTILGRPSR